MGDDWLDLEPAPKAPGANKDPVRFGLQKIQQAPARGVILLRQEALKVLQLATWRVAVRVGSGAMTKHQLAVVGDPHGAFELNEVGRGGGTWKLLLPHIDAFPDVKLAPIGRSWKAGKANGKPALLIDLPPCCFDKAAREALERKAG